MKTAIKPNYFVSIPTLDVERTAGAEPTDEERALYAMSVSSGWHFFKETLEATNRELNNINKEAIAQGLPLEEIGRNAIVITLVQGIIERLLNKVGDAVDVCENKE